MTAILNRRASLTLTAFASLGLAAASAQAQTSTAPNIYVYNFNDAGASGTNSAANTASLFSVDKTYNGILTGSTLSTNFAAANIVDFAGTAVNADGSDAAGVALALQGGTGAATGGVGGNNGGYLQLSANLTGFQRIQVSFANQATATGFTNDQFQYSTNGTTFTNFGSPFAPASSMTPGFTVAGPGVVESFDLSSIAGLNNNPNAAFRLVLNGASSSAGNIRIDNLLVSGVPAAGTPAVPEASTTVSLGLLLALGLGGLAVAKKRTARAS